MNLKFNIGDKVLDKKDPKKESHTVLGFTVDKKGVVYKVTMKEVDIENKKIIKGISFYRSDELVIRPKVKKVKKKK